MMSIKNFFRSNQPLTHKPDENVEMVRFFICANGEITLRSVAKTDELEWQNQLLMVENLNMRKIFTKILPRILNGTPNSIDNIYSFFLD